MLLDGRWRNHCDWRCFLRAGLRGAVFCGWRHSGEHLLRFPVAGGPGMLEDMKAQAGDWIRMPSSAGPARGGEIVAVWGKERSEPPFVVRFGGGRVRLVVPDASAVIEHRAMSELKT